MNRQLINKQWLYYAMALSLFAVLTLGIVHLAVDGKAHVAAMDARQLQTFSDGPLGSIGQVYDTRGEPLFTPGQPVDRAVHSVVGSLTPMIDNSVVNRAQGDLLGRDGYSLWRGAESLEGAGTDLFLTLDGRTQSALTARLEDAGISGLVAACDGSTGALLCLVSTPAAGSEDPVSSLPEGALLNKCLSTTTAGSTMKIVTTALLVEQAGPEALKAHRYTCQGSDTLAADGSTVVCSTRRGDQDIVSALGVSCNTFFANAIQNDLSVEGTAEALARYGLAPQTERKSLDPLTYAPSQVVYTDGTFSSVWSLLGQISAVSPLDMLRFTAAVFHEGQAPTPYLLDYQTDRTHTECLFQAAPDRQAILTPDTARQVAEFWTEAYETWYDRSLYSPAITAAKTGTAQQGGGRVNKTLMGYARDLDVVFFLSLEDWTPGQLTPQEVSACLLEHLADRPGD